MRGDTLAEREQHRRRETAERCKHLARDRLLGSLEIGHLLGDRAQPSDGMLDLNGKIGEHRGHAVV